ncbi:phosphoribosylaminoimidazolesuccinocarboxamide synthase [Candidatus Pacearchaeota archaeon]|nr:phosphoribosylaminoimidazolesuccinocarboxamide synthase [Candidatus Pacearchaeota archaeon]
MSGDSALEDRARSIVEQYVSREGTITPVQEILDSGEVPRLKGYQIRPGKVSDSLFGGKGWIRKKGDEFDTDFENPSLYTRDGKPLRIMVRTERISTHDINRGEIPFKDQILAENHNFMRKLLTPFIGTSQIDVPGLGDNSVVIAAENLKQISFENVLRAYMAKTTTSTSLYQHYIKGAREFCGHKLPDDLIVNGPLPYVMDTASTKSETHDESVPPEWLFNHSICTRQQYAHIRNSSLVSFGVVSEFLRQRGIIAVDTKTEHGINHNGEIVSQDEIWTMDSSRFWLANDYRHQFEQFKQGNIVEINPKSYSKEFARGMSVGEKGYTDEQRMQIAVRYVVGIEHLLGKSFEPDMRPRNERIVDGLRKICDTLVN